MLESQHETFLTKFSQLIENFDEFYNIMEKISMQTTARNQFLGTVVRIKSGLVNAKVTIKLKADQLIVAVLSGGNTLKAIVTKNVIEELGIQKGMSLCSFFKASSVILAVEDN